MAYDRPHSTTPTQTLPQSPALPHPQTALRAPPPSPPRPCPPSSRSTRPPRPRHRPPRRILKQHIALLLPGRRARVLPPHPVRDRHALGIETRRLLDAPMHQQQALELHALALVAHTQRKRLARAHLRQRRAEQGRGVAARQHLVGHLGRDPQIRAELVFFVQGLADGRKFL